MISTTENISLSLGPMLLVDKMFDLLELNPLFSRYKTKGVKMSSLVRGMVSCRMMDNFSIKQCSAWLNNPRVCQYYSISTFDSRTLYRTLEIIGEHFAEIMDNIQDNLFSHFHFEKTDIYMDWTTIVIWGLHADLAEYGYSRDKRGDKKQITIGLTQLAEPYNVPIGLTVNKGSLNDMLHFKSTFNQSERKLKKGSMAIFDKGANSKENLDLIEECGHDYLTAMKHNKSLDKHIQQFWEESPICVNPDESDKKKRIYGIKISYSGHYDYVYFSEQRKELDLLGHHNKAVRDLKEARFLEDCTNRKKKLPKKYTSSPNKLLKVTCSIQTNLVIGRTDEEILTELKNDLITGREGFFALKSSRNLTVKNALELYRKKDAIEKAFHSIKNEVVIKPVRLWTEKSIRGIVLICFIAQLFVSLSRLLHPEVAKVSTKFILRSLCKLTVTFFIEKSGLMRHVISNVEWINKLILNLV